MSSALDHVRRRGARGISGAGLAAGLLLLARPAAVAAAVDPGFPGERLWIARVLGARLVAQHGLALLRPDGASLRLAAVVDGLHAASMLPVLALPRYRRSAMVTGGLAVASALALRSVAKSRRR